jgi:hypothetical protein
MENISDNEESTILDRSFDTLASEIETNVLKALKVVTMSQLKSRFRQFLVKKALRPQITSPCICKKSRKTFILAVK